MIESEHTICSDQPGDLRSRALRQVRESASAAPKSRDASSHDETLRLLNELQVHQIELEMQNEELHRVQEDLQASRARYFELYDLAPVGYFTVSGQWQILEANLTAATQLGVTRNALVNRPFSDYVFREDQDTCHIQRIHLQKNGRKHSWEMRMSRADGSSFWANLEAVLVQNGECRIALSDISERKQVEATLALADARLWHLQKAESLERMAGSIAHHFNNKLQVVIGNLELAIGEQARGSGSPEVLREAMEAAFQAAGMSTTMLTLIGMNSTNLELLDLTLIGKRMLPLLQDSLPVGLALEAAFHSPHLIVRAQNEQLQQLLVNVVTNAGEAVGTAIGTVRLTVTTATSADIPVVHRFPVDWVPKNIDYACLEISDTGRGIADKDVEKIFDPFFSDKFVGRGLGLAVVLGVLRAHDGAVAVRSRPGRGSTFRIFLPLAVEERRLSAEPGLTGVTNNGCPTEFATSPAGVAAAAVMLFAGGPLSASETDERIESSFKNSSVARVYLKDDAVKAESKNGVV